MEGRTAPTTGMRGMCLDAPTFLLMCQHFLGGADIFLEGADIFWEARTFSAGGGNIFWEARTFYRIMVRADIFWEARTKTTWLLT